VRLSVALPLLAASAALVAGCGSGSSGAASGPSAGEPPATTTAHPLPQSQLLVLTQGDAGHGSWTVPQQTHPLSFAEAAKGDPAAIKALERRTYLNGYEAQYGAPRGIGVLSTAAVFRTPEATAKVAAAWNRQAVRSLPHAKAIAIQGEAPGRGAILVSASFTANGHRIPLWIVQWWRGPVIGAAGVFGPGTTAARALALARVQDHRIALATAG
jgi:hypothetical protein